MTCYFPPSEYCYFPSSRVLYQQLSSAVGCQEEDEKKKEILKVVAGYFGEKRMLSRNVKWWAKIVLLDSEKLPSLRFYNENKRTIVKTLLAYRQQARL